jgi:hypothetical protein
VEIYFNEIFEYLEDDSLPFVAVTISRIKYYLAANIQEMCCSNVFFASELKLAVHSSHLN